MKLVPYEKSKIKRGFKPTKLFAFIEEFRNSDWDGAKVEGWEENYKNLYSAQSSIINSIKHFKITGIRAVVVNGELFLVKESEAAE